jgi:16S rRNA processing protein RimM
MTVRVASGHAARWTALTSVWIAPPGDPEGRLRAIRSSRAYGDRLVLRLEGVDEASAAEALRGAEVAAPAEQVPVLPSGVHFVSRLLGARVRSESGASIGVVTGVESAGGSDLLAVTEEDGQELLIPMAEAIVLDVDTAGGVVTVRLPEGLRELNRKDG